MRRFTRPDWAQWNAGAGRPWTIGVEEEVMLLDGEHRLAYVIDDLLPRLSPGLAASAAAETHAGTLELATGVHSSVGDAIGELSVLRAQLRDELADAGLQPGAAGTHPLSEWQDTRVSAGARYQLLESSMRDLTRREPTFALHVHVGVPDPEVAVEVVNRMRAHLPVLLALSANSPFLRGRETGFASARTPLFQAFPRVGIPRRYRSYDDWVGAIAPLIDAGAVPESTFFWWDVRLQPRLGTVEVRIMDAQTSQEHVAALVALTQALVVMEATDRLAPGKLVDSPEVLDENRFLAARDGMQAELVDPRTSSRIPVRELVDEMVEAASLHARRLGSADELDLVTRLADDPPAERQRRRAEEAGLAGVAAALAEGFCDSCSANSDSGPMLAH
ncbi:MAG: glutamate---cysteine ligase / carboxylate-amine ligase [Thermoleophilaceae bacterium]|nr:glutamate---cysteine ligase / carboxylate-amine ligase [Thermoleophilaceae bacterium]